MKESKINTNETIPIPIDSPNKSMKIPLVRAITPAINDPICDSIDNVVAIYCCWNCDDIYETTDGRCKFIIMKIIVNGINDSRG